MNSEENKGGRPLKFTSAKDLEEKINAYFNACDPHMEEITEWVEARSKDGKLLKDQNGLSYLTQVTHKVMTKQVPYTITGLALALDTTRRTLIDYQEKDDEFSHTIKKAKVRIENFNEQLLYNSSPIGTIFNLKNNYGWKDKTEVEATVNDPRKDILDKYGLTGKTKETKG